MYLRHLGRGEGPSHETAGPDAAAQLPPRRHNGNRHPPKVRAEAIARALEGEPRIHIAQDLNIPVDTLHKWLLKLRKNGKEVPDRRFRAKAERADNTWTLRIPPEVAYTLRPLALARGYRGVQPLAVKLLRILSEEPHLIDAVLDEK